MELRFVVRLKWMLNGIRIEVGILSFRRQLEVEMTANESGESEVEW
jgi:hypothetical protein